MIKFNRVNSTEPYFAVNRSIKIETMAGALMNNDCVFEIDKLQVDGYELYCRDKKTEQRFLEIIYPKDQSIFKTVDEMVEKAYTLFFEERVTGRDFRLKEEDYNNG